MNRGHAQVYINAACATLRGHMLLDLNADRILKPLGKTGAGGWGEGGGGGGGGGGGIKDVSFSTLDYCMEVGP